MAEGEERDPVLDQAVEIFKGKGEITIASIMQKCCISFFRAQNVYQQMKDLGYPVDGTKREDAARAQILRELMDQMFGRNGGGEKSRFQVSAPARKCSQEEIDRILADAPQKREDMTVSLGEYAAFGYGIRVFIDYGKDIAYKRVNSENGVSYSLLSMDIPNFVRRLKEIVSSWEHEMVDHRILDGMCYHVSIQKKGEDAIEYRGQNKFPENYREFSVLLRALDETTADLS